MANESVIIDIIPTIPDGLIHGQEVPYGWAVRIHRWLSDRSGQGIFRKVKPLPRDTGEPLEGSLWVSLEERRESAEAPQSKEIYSNREFSFRCARNITGWDCRWYESTVVEVELPFQKRLPRDGEITYVLSVGVEDASGMELGSAQRSFANLPTWCLWEVELDRPGGIEKVVNGRRIVAGTRAAVYPGDFTGEGRAGFLHLVGSLYIAAYDATGKKFWDYDDPAGAPVYNSTNASVGDINGDGRDEIIVMRGKPPEARLEILEGVTGRILKSVLWPGNGEDMARWHHGGNRGDMAYTYDAKIYLADFRGLGRPQDIVLQTGDENQALYTALNNELEVLWEFDVRRQRQIDGGAGSHVAIIYDINGDGEDEMLAGTYMLSSGGEILWMIPFEPLFAGGGDNHIDGADIGPVGEDRRIVVAFPNNCVVADAVSGEVLWKKGSDHGQVAYVRKLRRDLPGNQIIFSEKLNTRRLFDAQGKEINCTVGNGTERDWWADGEGMHLWPIAESRLVDWDGSGEQDQVVGSLVLDRTGRCIGVGEWTACPLVDEKVWGSTVLQLRLNFNVTRVRAFSGVPIPPPGNKKLNLPLEICNCID